MIAESYVTLHCRCGHEADIDEFCRTPVGGELPRGHYQCPQCRRAWSVRRGPPRVGWSGMVLPGETIIEDEAPCM